MSLDVRRLDTCEPGFDAALDELLYWDVGEDDEVNRIAGEIIRDVRRRGDDALVELTARLDRWQPSAGSDLLIDAGVFRTAFESLGDAEREALEQAAARIEAYHRHQLDADWSFTDADGSVLGQRVQPLDRAGLYVPGGQAAYPSTVLMTAIPARVAGVGEVVMTVPTPDGVRNPLVMAAAHVAGIERGFRLAVPRPSPRWRSVPQPCRGWTRSSDPVARSWRRPSGRYSAPWASTSSRGRARC